MAIQIVIGNNGFIKTQDIHREDCVREKTGVITWRKKSSSSFLESSVGPRRRKEKRRN